MRQYHYIYFLYCYFVPLYTVALYYSPILYILYHSIAILQDCKNANYGYYYIRCFPLITLLPLLLVVLLLSIVFIPVHWSPTANLFVLKAPLRDFRFGAGGCGIPAGQPPPPTTPPPPHLTPWRTGRNLGTVKSECL